MQFKSFSAILLAVVAVQAVPVQETTDIEARDPQGLLSSFLNSLFPPGSPFTDNPFGDNGAGNGNGNPYANGDNSQNGNGNPNDNGAGNGNGNPNATGDNSQNNNGNPTDSGNGNNIGVLNGNTITLR